MNKTHNWRANAIVCGIVVLATLVIYMTPARVTYDKNVTLPVNFYLRSLIHRDPPVSPLLKVYAFDDKTLQYLDRPELSLSEWSQLLTALAATKPKGIYIDKLFGTPDTEGRSEFVDSIKRLDVPIVSGGFLHPGLIRKNSLVAMNERPEYSLSEADIVTLKDRPMPQVERHLYGPHVDVQKAFTRIGHLQYEGDGRVAPWIKIGADKLIPHISLALESTSGRNSQIPDLQRSLHPDFKGLLTVNLLPPSSFAKNFYSLKSALERIKNGSSFAPVINEGQTILILPGAFTGSSDWVETPLGYLPGGYVVASMLNSVLTEQWLVNSNLDWLWCICCVIAATLLPWSLSPAAWMVTAVTIGISIAVLNISAFIWTGLVTTWPLMVLAYTITAASLFVFHRHNRERQIRDEQVRRAEMNATAAVVQYAFFHDQKTPDSLVKFAASHQPADTIGGDWYGIYEYPSKGYVFLFIGDVTGHGISSALMVCAVAGAVNSTLPQLIEAEHNVQKSLEQLASVVNKVVFDSGYAVEKAMTMAFIGLDLKSRRAHLLNCGHLPIYVRSEDKVKSIAIGGDILGMTPNITCRPCDWEIKPGDTILTVTDGLFDNRGPNGARVKINELKRLISGPQLSPAELCSAIRATVTQKWQTIPLRDDCTFCIVAID